MHARVITHRVMEGNLDQVLRVISENIEPAARKQPGFLAFVVMSYREAGVVVSTSYWNTEADMLASENAYYLQDQISRLITLLRGSPAIAHYGVDLMS
jgi:quinol monooxygenase YgiN